MGFAPNRVITGDVVTGTVNVSAAPDTPPPVITLIGANPMNLTVGDTYSDPGATAIDDVDGNISGSIVISGDTVNTSIAGTYVVRYNVSDSSGNAANEVTRTVNVSAAPDTTPPVITLIGANPMNLTVGDTYSESSATAIDNVDGNISGSIVISGDTVNTNIVGSYVVRYNVSDAAGNAAVEVTRIVNVVDSTSPVITLTGANPMDVNLGSTYTEPGATAIDDVDGDITGSILMSGTVDTNTLGSYVVSYNVSDAAGNAAVEVTRTVNVVDGTPPVITLTGADPIYLSLGDTYTEPGATATDNVDGDISGSIVIAGSVDTSTVGNYVLTYNVSDASGNAAIEVTRTVSVVIAINAGGSAYTAEDGINYEDDNYFSGGQVWAPSSPPAIAGTNDDVLYQSSRYGEPTDFSYNIPIANGTYDVTFKFAEIFYTSVGDQVFDVIMEGSIVIDNLDILTQVAQNEAYDVTLPVTISDGQLNFTIGNSTNDNIISAILVRAQN
jgi:hypothetical protein